MKNILTGLTELERAKIVIFFYEDDPELLLGPGARELYEHCKKIVGDNWAPSKSTHVSKTGELIEFDLEGNWGGKRVFQKRP